MKLCLEVLEDRDLLAASALVSGDVLVIVGTGAADKVAVAAAADQTVVDLDGDGDFDFTTPTAGLTRVVVDGRGGDDILASQPGQNLPATILGGAGDDNITAFVQSTLAGGPGNDMIYQIVAPGVVDGGAGVDRIIVSVAVQRTGDNLDATPVIFGQAQTATVANIGRVVYFLGTPNDDVAFVNTFQQTLVVKYNNLFFSFNSVDVDAFAGIFGAGNDTFILSDTVTQPAVAYGLSGNDYLSGGAGNDLFKGGADSDVVLGGLGDDDLTGSNGQADAAVDYVDGGDGFDLARVDSGDVFFAEMLVGVLSKKKRWWL